MMRMKEQFFRWIVSNKQIVSIVFIAAFLLAAAGSRFVKVNYDLNEYLPKDSSSTIAIDKMEETYGGGIPNVRVMAENVSIPEALDLKNRLKSIDGVREVLWLDDVADMTVPVEIMGEEIAQSYYKGETALFTVTIDKSLYVETIEAIKKEAGENAILAGPAQDTAESISASDRETGQRLMLAIPFCFLVLLLTTTSYFEPVILLGSVLAAVVLNMGSNLILGEISFVTNSAGSILQLAVSLDYSVFLLHRFKEIRKAQPSLAPEEAMVQAMCKSTGSILSSGLTTIIGFLALLVMRFKIGPDMGVVLAKGIILSLLTVFTFFPAMTLYAEKWIDKTAHQSFMPSFAGLSRLIVRVMLPCTLLFVLILVPVFLASGKNSYYYGTSHIFGPETKVGQDKQQMNEIFGKNNQFVLMVPDDSLVDEQILADEIKGLPGIETVLSYTETVGMEVPLEFIPDDQRSRLVQNGYSRLVITSDTDLEGEDAFGLVETIRQKASVYYGDNYYLAGESVSTYDLKETVTKDMVWVNLLAIGAVFLVLLFFMKSLTLPVLLVLSIETAIWMNLSIPYFADTPLFYIGYLIISSIQLGATVDYAILFTDRYMEFREENDKKETIRKTVQSVTVSILTSGVTMTVMGFLLGKISSHGIISQLGYLLGKGTLCSMGIVFFVIPGLLYLFDGLLPSASKGGSLAFIKERMKKYGKTVRRAGSILLVMSLAASAVLPVRAETLSAGQKEETIYARLGAGGAMQEVYAVNSFPGGDIEDYGNYSQIKNLNTKDKIQYDNGTISFYGSSERVYYQGTMKEAELPWIFTIRYFLDGAEIEASELAGKSGELKITLAVNENPKAPEGFFDAYSLQMTAKLDGESSSHLSCPGATIVNAGKMKQIIMTVMPGKEKEFEISARVANFSMEGISINGMRLELGLNADDIKMEGLEESTVVLKDTAEKFDEGAKALSKGAKSLEGGAERLKAGTGELGTGINSYTEGVGGLKKGIDSVSSGAGELEAGAGTVSQGVDSLKSGTDSLLEGSRNLMAGAGTLLTGAETMKNQSQALAEAAGSFNQQIQAMPQEGLTLTEEQLAAIRQSAADNGSLDEAAAQMSDALAAGVAQNIASQISQEAVIGEVSRILQDQAGIPEEQAGPMAAGICGTIAGGIHPESISQEELKGICLGALKQTAAASAEGAAKAVMEQSGSLMGGIGELKQAGMQLSQGTAGIAQGAADLYEGIHQLDQGIEALAGGAASLDGGASSLKEGVTALSEGVSELSQGSSQLKQGAEVLVEKTPELTSGVNQLDQGAGEVKTGAGELRDGSRELKNGTEEFVKKTGSMEQEIDETVEKSVKSITGGEYETVSFVSPENGSIKSVQFVMLTEKIGVDKSSRENASKDTSMQDKNAIEAEGESKPGFLKKLSDLFGKAEQEGR